MNIFEKFTHELETALKNISKFNSNNIFVIRDINNSKLTLVNINTAKEIELEVDNPYDFNLGSGVSIKNNKVSLISQFFNIENIPNQTAKNNLEDMYFCLNEEKNAIYSIKKIENNKIYLTNIKEGGFFSIPREKLPNSKIGDLVQNINGKLYLF